MERYILSDVKTTILLYMQVQLYNHYLKGGSIIKVKQNVIIEYYVCIYV
jgi:hypothetical protein